jgi:hypothetical protein
MTQFTTPRKNQSVIATSQEAAVKRIPDTAGGRVFEKINYKSIK